MMLDIKKFSVGMSAQLERTFSDLDVNLFSELSGDKNPVHLNEDYAKNTVFTKRIVHGALASSIFSSIFANTLPGPGSIYLKSKLLFLKPIYLNEKVNFSVEIIEIIHSKNRIILKTNARSNDSDCIVGEAEIYIP